MSKEKKSLLNSFNSKIGQHQIQLMKAAIPYFNIEEQKLIHIFIQVQELTNTLALFHSKSNIQMCAAEHKEVSLVEMLSDLKEYCYDSEKETIDMILNFMNIFEMYNTYNDLFGMMDLGGGEEPSTNSKTNSNSNSTPFSLDVLKGMLTPEQQSMLDTYTTLFQNM